jgi:hypothetical protein
MGRSVGRWENDTLVVDTVGFNDLSLLGGLEYACHEGNYSVANMLSGSRADEKRAEDKAKQGPNLGQ